MLPELHQDRSGLRWIRGDLDQTLHEARTALEDFVDGRPDRLRECIDSLHHIRGALEMVQVYGAAMLADEMEQLALALAQGNAKRMETAAEALMLGMVQLPAYLEKIEDGATDVPLVLLPLMNDLRAARDASLVSETSLFAPKLNVVIAADTVRPGSGNRALPQLIHDQRSHFHRGLLNWIRGQGVPAALQHIREVLEILRDAAGTSRLRRLLDAGEALAVALRDEQQAPALAVKPLFGKLDRVFKQIIDQGEEAAMLDFPIDLLKNMLYYIARSHSEDPVVVGFKQAADLASSFPHEPLGGSALGGPDRELFKAVAEALAQNLRDVKDQLDLYMRSDRGQLGRLTSLAPPVQRIADTLGMVGRGDLRTRLKHRCDELRAAEQAGEPLPDERLMTLASDLLFVESSLSSLSAGTGQSDDRDQPREEAPMQLLPEGELRLHFRAALDQALAELAKAKDAILAYLEKPVHAELLSEVPTHMHAVVGALQVLELPEAARLLDALRPYIAGLASGQTAVPNNEQRDALADVVISTESYMQSTAEPGSGRERILAYAGAALDRLGLGEGEVDAVAAAAPQEAAVTAGEALTQIPEQEVRAVAGTQADDLASTSPQAVAVDAVDVDSEILEIFSEEAEEELQVIEGCYPKWRDDQADQDSLLTMRRSFHTLKGSGRIVGASNIGEFSWAVENLLNRVIEGTVPVSRDIFTLMDDVVAVLPRLVEETQQLGVQVQGTDVSSLSERAFALASADAGTAAAGAAAAAPGAELETREQARAAPSGGFAEVVEDQPAVDLSAALLSAEPDASVPAETPAEIPLEVDELLPGAASQDAHMALGDADAGVAQQAPDQAAETTEMDLSFLALEDGAAEAIEGPDLSLEPMDESAESAAGRQPAAEQEYAADESILSDAEVRDSEFSELESTASSVTDSGLDAVFVNEAAGHLSVLADFIRRCRGQADSCVFDDSVRRAMHTLHGSSRTAGMQSMAELSSALEEFSNAMYRQRRLADAGTLELLERSHQSLTALAATVEDVHAEAPDWEFLRDEINGLLDALVQEVPGVEQTVSGSGGREALDPELLEIFLEEAKELLEAFEGELADWAAAIDDQLPVAKLQRTLHTIKGGARLAGVSALGDLSHALESVFESVSERRIAGSDRLLALVRHAGDALAEDIEVLNGGDMPAPHTAMVERLESAAHGRDWDDVSATEAAVALEQEAPRSLEPEPDQGEAAEEPETETSAGPESELLADSQLMTDSELLADSSMFSEVSAAAIQAGLVGSVVSPDSTVVQFPGADQQVEGDGFVARRPLPEDLPAPAAGSERVRVSSEALDQMVNNAGEVSIYRARLEQQSSASAFNLGELQQTIDRLRSQLRNLELETEAQILSRHEREGDALADFDPLELDRYSTMQQLSRALSETVEDLSNLGHSLSELNRDTDTLLLQQARVTTDLQDGLLRTRMVKFSSRVPRLERVVRQTSHSLGKRANLEVIGGKGDMDRAILERMMSPLEHLLRNAVSHGIEMADVRLANGKPAQGLITVQLAREGADVVLTLTDDGAGLDRASIKAKAIERGLIDANAEIEDNDLYQLILQPGFSTAQELSQVAGRGVGMDIVLTEVKQLGGTLEIGSQPGKGASFTIRLPFTLAITDALLMTVGDEIYAVPHSSMDGVARISLDELRAIYAGEQDAFSYDGREYSMRYLGSILGTQNPHLAEGMRWLPLLLVHSGEHRVAIQVDGLLGNRQIVVKSIGAQLSAVPWFTGGTILADGQVALILDVNSLVRADGVQQPVTPLAEAAPVSKGVSVMVVDDSITVRKVTSRLLERHNMHVVTAKDGVDAVTLLQEHRPDVMLLDIEMPRMDGYELARHMRSTPELSHIPIIMITSRTGDKHRNRALEFGVKCYLGKPYQEADLLENIYTVLADTAL